MRAERGRGGALALLFPAVTGSFLAFALLRGGSSADPPSAHLIQLCAAPLLAVAIWRWLHLRRAGSAAWPLAILLGALALAVAQLCPLPLALWAALPGRRAVVEGYLAAGMGLPALPLSLTPSKTWSAALGLLPPAAIFWASLTLDARARIGLANTVIAIALASAVLGMAQLSSGSPSALRLYDFTDASAGVGLFANRNHQALFLVVALPFAALITLMRTSGRGPPKTFWIFLGFAAAVLLTAGIAAARSRAGLVLAAPAMMAALALAVRAERDGPGPPWRPIALGGGFALAAALTLVFQFSRLADRFVPRLGDDLRSQIAPVVLEAGHRFAPFGSGLGSFDTVYPMFERPAMVSEVFVNHAHNDYLEIWLECGWPGAALILAFIGWWAAATIRTFARPGRPETSMSLCASAATALVLVHSLVDYPLRTPALAVLFAFSCALMTPPPSGENQEHP